MLPIKMVKTFRNGSKYTEDNNGFQSYKWMLVPTEWKVLTSYSFFLILSTQTQGKSVGRNITELCSLATTVWKLWYHNNYVSSSHKNNNVCQHSNELTGFKEMLEVLQNKHHKQNRSSQTTKLPPTHTTTWKMVTCCMWKE